MYQKQGASAYKADLSNIKLLDNHLNHPHKTFKSIHVAGTNGKGSTSHMLASVFHEAGYKVGLYTSPHLKDFRERIKINGKMISEIAVVNFVKQNKRFFEEHQLSFFEMTVGMAFDYFSKENVDIAIIEVGLGGRLDSTNIITPEVSVITNIGLDHTKFLGDTMALIAKEKGGIIKDAIPIVIGETTSKTRDIFKTIAKSKSSPIYFSEDMVFPDYTSDLKGDYQKHNKQTVLQTIEILKENWAITKEHISKGLDNVIKNTGLLGRWQILDKKPLTICDTAHNTEGLTIALKQLLNLEYNNLHIVLGVVNDKNLDSILPLFPKSCSYYFCKPSVPRGLNACQLKVKAEEFELFGDDYNSVTEAYQQAKKSARKNDLIYIGGSTFVVAEII